MLQLALEDRTYAKVALEAKRGLFGFSTMFVNLTSCMKKLHQGASGNEGTIPPRPAASRAKRVAISAAVPVRRFEFIAATFVNITSHVDKLHKGACGNGRGDAAVTAAARTRRIASAPLPLASSGASNS